MRNVKCRFKGVSERDRIEFKGSSCLLSISVGQEYHEEKKFEATIALINKTFRQCKIMLYDGLQRYTMTLNNKAFPSHFLHNAIAQGDEWLKRNQKYYRHLNNLTDIIRWDHWLSHPHFLEMQYAITKHIQEDLAYRTTFEETIHSYLARYINRLSPTTKLDQKHAHDTCLSYLIEECAALCLWPETGCDYEVYPTKRNLAMEATHKHFVLPTHPNKLHSVPLKFIHTKQLKPQILNYEATIQLAMH